jgi:hypothetical protein
MSKSQKPRKAYRPRMVNPNACMIALERFKVLRQDVNEAFAGEFEMAALTSLDAVTRGYGQKSQWDTLANCLNQAWLFAKGGLGAEALDTFDAAHEAMRRMIPGYEATGKLGFVSHADQVAVEEAIALWGQQLRMATIGEVDAATKIVEREYWKHAERRAA